MASGLSRFARPSTSGPHKTLYNLWKRWSDKRRYKQRNCIEIVFGGLKDSRRVATRNDRCPKVFLPAIVLAVIVIYWL
ncbi:Transposase DDE domain-containing protein [Pseudooceanicola antarcticus]|uniref:Transposase DDE domain-containing protein n=1 Tax=Pseudooceanicola antarcticus TaxID=1247613 RepID=A0A285IW90_9RHOB|nr:Transposase DDE domain-containing protein [Pseudooceanicola antarcticus]